MPTVRLSKKIEWPVVVVFREFTAIIAHEPHTELTAFEHNRMYTITQQKGESRVDTTYRFEPVHGGTRVTVEFDSVSEGMPTGLPSSSGWAIDDPAVQWQALTNIHQPSGH